MKKSDYTKETLLDVLSSYHRMIERSGTEFPTVVLGDIKKSIESVLRANEYNKGFFTFANNPKVQIFRSNDQGRAVFYESLKYWSNCTGDLHRYGKEDITEEQLPPVLKRAYNELWNEDTGSYCYLVETPKGYGIALINEYDKWFSEDCGLSLDELFEFARKDASIIADDSVFSKAEIYLGESMGLDRCHELAVIFPADISKEEFDLAAARLDSLAYQSAKTFQKPSLSSQIESAGNRAVRTAPDTISNNKEPEL